MRVIISGAGIAGLTTAAALVRDGHDVTVLERRRDTAAGAGITLWPNALAALDEIGLGDAVRAESARVAGGAIRWRDGSWIRQPSEAAMIAALGEPVAVIRRSTLRDVLTDALPTGTVDFDVAVAEAHTHDDAAIVTTSTGQRLRADVFVAADGTKSRVARTFNSRLADAYTGYSAWRGIADVEIDPALAGEVLGPVSEFGTVPLSGGQTYWFATSRLRPNTRFGDELSQVRALARRWPDPIATVVAATRREELSRTDLYDRRTAQRWYDGRIVLAGDSAHPMRPHLGQGGCQGIEDAVVLAAALAKYPDLDVALPRYQGVRQPRVRKIVNESRAIGRITGARPAFLWGSMIRASAIAPDTIAMKHLGAIAGYSNLSKQLDSL